MTSLTLLCVDDEKYVLNSLRRLLRHQPYKLLTASSGAEGLKMLEAEPVQVVMSDYRMPDISGTEFLSIVKKDFPNTIRLLLSSYPDGQSIRKAINDEVIVKALPKPWHGDELILEIQHCFE